MIVTILVGQIKPHIDLQATSVTELFNPNMFTKVSGHWKNHLKVHNTF